ncbi:hypothetical protein N7478_011602 [Penicillium angulare]|uniref:uncharacterized protein n=1 Tax=Penicillium angulare TaxID=116970 RepID=UPI0025402054|nr:uncharacterized protein N7478_011602 [Penicillium angulare]KAJ5261007.1 hypothetical protein N7478_011602 [Penicillium angulare]
MGSIAEYIPSETRLFKPIKIGQYTLQHRIALPPLTRLRNNDDHVPLPLMEKYYADRGSTPGTLVIAEATAISHGEEGDWNNPGLVSNKQVEGWRKIINAVHANKSIFFQQIWGMGRASRPDLLSQRGFPYRSSSAVPMKGTEHVPQAMTEEEILETIRSFAETAQRAVLAGADGVEIHSAHGYLLDQFLTASVNQRTDKWGGSIEGRARLTLEVVKAVVQAVGAERVALRLSPYAGFQGSEKADFLPLYTYIIDELKKMNVQFAYLSLVEATGDPGALIWNDKNIHQGKSLNFILESWNNLSPVIVAGGYTPESAAWAVENTYAKWNTLVAFGRHFISNPDLVFKIRNDIPLTPYNRPTFYNVKEWSGYNDYPFSQEFLEAHSDAVHPMTKEEGHGVDI